MTNLPTGGRWSIAPRLGGIDATAQRVPGTPAAIAAVLCRTISAVRAAPAFSVARNRFVWGAVVKPLHDVVGGTSRESGVSQRCVEREVIDKIVALSPTWANSKWVTGTYVSSSPNRSRDVMRIVSTHYGWRVKRRPPRGGAWLTLSCGMSDLPILFPSMDAAMLAAEVFFVGQHWEIDCLTWVDLSKRHYYF